MLAILLKILGIIGMVLLILLGLLLGVLLLVLFCPVRYQGRGQVKGNDSIDIEAAQENSSPKIKGEIKIKVRWLFGVFRADYQYPHPGQFIVKLLFFTLYNSEQPKKKSKAMLASENNIVSKSNTEKKTYVESQENPEYKESAASKTDQKEESNVPSKTDITEHKLSETERKQRKEIKPEEDQKVQEEIGQETDSEIAVSWWEKLLESFQEKYQKIKYTICKICDKIKYILENYSYYKTLFSKEETKQSFMRAKFRLKKILKHIRPRNFGANIRFGTGSPDTTGYCLGIYGMLMPYLGKNVNITPNFEEAELEGEFYISGHITIVIVLWHVIFLLLDKRLRLLIRRLKKQEDR